MTSSLGKKIIRQKLESFVPTTRKGRPRGEPIGLNKTKYTAALMLAVYDVSSTELEDILEVPRSLVSKWRTEPAFIRHIEEIQHQAVTEMAEAIRNLCDVKVFADASMYSLGLKCSLVSLCDTAVVEQDGAFLLACWPVLRIAIALPL